MRFVLGLLCALVVAAPAWASEEEARAAYDAYRQAQGNGDLRGALGHARMAYDQAILQWGEGTPETYRYVAALARVQNDLLEFEDAFAVVNSAIKANQQIEGILPYSYELYFESGRALRGKKDFEDAELLFTTALWIAEAQFGSDSVRAAYVHLELARTHLDSSPSTQFYRLIGTGYPQVAGDSTSLVRASEILATGDADPVQLQILEAARAGHLMAQDDMDAAGDILEPAVASLVSQGYMDDYVLGLYVDWIASHFRDWNTRQMERMLLQAKSYGLLRREGGIIPLARTLAARDRRGCIDDLEGLYGMLEYSVNADGQVPRTAVVESTMPRRWDDEIRRTMRQTWTFIPAQQNGEAVRVDGLRMVLRQGARSC